MTPEELLLAGNSILAEVLVPAGFALKAVRLGEGSGGDFAIGMWARGPQFIELHVRFGLGIVRYGWGAEAFDHRHIVGALTASTSYPGFSDDPVDAFRHLAQDLAGPLAPVLQVDNDVLRLAREWMPPGPVLP